MKDKDANNVRHFPTGLLYREVDGTRIFGGNEATVNWLAEIFVELEASSERDNGAAQSQK